MICTGFKNCLASKRCCLNIKDTSCINHYKKEVICKQNKREYCLVLKEQVTALKYEIDGHVIYDNNQIRCDNLILTDGFVDKDKAIFIELKGTNLHHAYDQLYESITSLKNIIGSNYKYYARIVHTGGTQANSIKDKERLNKLLKQINKSEKGIFVLLSSRIMKETIDKFTE